MNVILQQIEQQYGKVLQSDFRELTFSQTTPYLEINFAKYFLQMQQVVISVYPTLYTAMQTYQNVATEATVVFFAADEFMSAQLLSASPELLLERIATLDAIIHAPSDKPIWVITHVAAIMRPIVAPETFRQFSRTISIGEDLGREIFLSYLTEIGYERVPIVSKPGEVAVRGEVIDIYSPNYDLPLRFSFFDTELEHIFQFNIQDQLTKNKLETVTILPLSDQFRAADCSIFDYFKTYITLFHQHERIITTYEHVLQDVAHLRQNNEGNEVAYLAFEDLKFMTQQHIRFTALGEEHAVHGVNLINEKKHYANVLQEELAEYMKRSYNVICLSGEYDLNIVRESLVALDVPLEDISFVSDMNFDEVIHSLELFIFDYTHLLGIDESKQKQEVFSKLSLEDKVSHVDEIEPGDYVVHVKHGIGRYDGLQTITAQGIERDYVVLSYKNDEKIYLPIEKIKTLYKYAGSTEGFVPKLSKINDRSWKRKTDKVQEQVDAFAEQLFQLYLERERIPGFAFGEDTEKTKEFEAVFPYEETTDQLTAIEEIKSDMEKPFVMDRLLVGDVGFGKTEVAFRAAFKAMEAGKQVALLAPTTILARQHYENALRRFARFDYRIGMLSRLVSPKKQAEIIFNTEIGDVNFLIGTHRLLSNDVVYDDLGLVIIDEEHRFGVKDKEKLKQLRKNVDILQISATPIPRTLQMAVNGIREMSLLQTPPHNRYPIQTYVLEQNDNIVRDAIERELARNGQTYYLYNKVASISQMTAKLTQMFPFASVDFVHGQMPKAELEDIITRFVDKKIDVLVSTTIIENGMDIPNANTLIVHDADTMGLSQLYQIRGRVGRSKRIAYSYFMYNKGRVLTEDAQKRLQTIQSFTAFGSGYQIAMRDLAIRGAGDMLGKAQSGFINDVGFDLYVDMLEHAIAERQTNVQQKSLRSLFAEDVGNQAEVFLQVPTFIPSRYISDESIKIDVYQMLAKMNSETDFVRTQEILHDRFGVPPIEVENLSYLFLYRNIAHAYGVRSIRQVRNKVILDYQKGIVKRLNRVVLFKALHAKGIEVQANDTNLKITINTLRKDMRNIFQEILAIMEIVSENWDK